MRKTIISTFAALALVSGSAFAAFDGVHGGATTGVTSTSGAFAASSGNGAAVTETGGYQSATAGFRGSSSASYWRREGHASVSGIAATAGGAFSVTHTRGNAIAGSGTAGSANAASGGFGYFDTHGRNPEGWAKGGAHSVGVNEAGTFSYGYGGAGVGNETSNVSTYSATAWGNRDGGWGRPVTDSVTTSATASSVSTRDSGGFRYGNGSRDQYRVNFGGAFAASHAHSGNVHSNN